MRISTSLQLVPAEIATSATTTVCSSEASGKENSTVTSPWPWKQEAWPIPVYVGQISIVPLGHWLVKVSCSAPAWGARKRIAHATAVKAMTIGIQRRFRCSSM